MKINSIICISFLALMTFISCENHEFISENISEKSSNIKSESAIEFTKIIANAVKDKDIREFIKQQALLQIDNDYDVIYHYVKDLKMNNGKTFRENLSLHCNNGNIDKLDQITDIDKTLTILVPYIKNVFNAKTWNIENIIPCVAYRNEENDRLSTFNVQGDLSYLARYSKPQEAVLVVKSNERLMAIENGNAITRSNNANAIANKDGVFGYFIDEEFNNIKKPEVSVLSRATTSSSQPEIYVNFDTTDKLYIASLAKESSARDYIYYGISSVLGIDEGSLDNEYREYITYIQFNDYESLGHINDIENQAPDADWSDGNLEIVFDFTFLTKEAAISTVKKMVSIKTEKLFNTTTQSTMKYYLPYPIEVFNWDLAKFGDTYRIDVSEYDSGTQSQYTSSISSVYGSNFKSEAGGSLFGLIKVGANYSYSETTTKQATTVITSTNNSDPLGSVFINFFDPIYTNDKVYISWNAWDEEWAVPFYSADELIDRGKSGLDQFISKLKNGLYAEEIIDANPFYAPGAGYCIEIFNYRNYANESNLYTSNTGMITLGVEPRKVYQ